MWPGSSTVAGKDKLARAAEAGLQGRGRRSTRGGDRLSHHRLQAVSELSRKRLKVDSEVSRRRLGRRLQVEVVEEDERGEAEREEEQVVVVARRVGEVFVRRVKHEARPVHSWSRERRLLAGAARGRRQRRDRLANKQ